MKIDTSTYYPEALLPEDPDEERKESEMQAVKPEDSDREEEEKKQEQKAAEIRGDYEPSGSEGERIADGMSTFLSWALVPLMMPVYGILLAFNLSILAFTPFASKLVFTLITIAFNLAVPALLVYLLKRIGVVQDIGLNGQKERLIPYIVTILCMGGTGLFMWHKEAPMWLVMFFLGGAIAGLVNMLVNFRWKISAHAAGIAGIVALMIRIIRDGFPQTGAFTWLLVTIILAGLLGSARVWLGRHTVWQVIAGYAVGFLSVILMTLIR